MTELCPTCPFAQMVAKNRAAQLAKSLWTPDKIRGLHKMAAAGATGKQIGEALGFSRGAALGQCFRQGIKLTRDKAKYQHFVARKRGEALP